MLDLYHFSLCLNGSLTAANVGILWQSLRAFLCISYGGGIRTLSRYTDCSERSLFRFIAQTIDWEVLFVKLFAYFVYKKEEVYLLVADETVERKSGKSTYGKGSFYSSILKMVIPSVCFVGFSLVAVGSRKSYFMGLSQVVHTDQDKERIAAQKAKKVAAKGQPKGRKKGSKNAPKTGELGVNMGEETASFRTFKDFFTRIIACFCSTLPSLGLSYLVVDSAYGNAKYVLLAQQKGLYLLSKLRTSPALFFPHTAPEPPLNKTQKSTGRPPKYGQRVDMEQLPHRYLVDEKTNDGIRHQTYQYPAWNKEMPAFLLNVVSIVSTHLKTGKISYTHFFSNDPQLTAQHMMEYYQLRFQIEFDFRDAKQHFGLHQLKNYHQTQLNNMFNLAFLALLTAKIWQQEWASKLRIPNLSLLDLKAIFKAQQNLKCALKVAKNNPNLFLNPQFIHHFVPNDLINAA